MMPIEWGGPEMSPAQQVEVIEELARANASAAWCVMIGCDSGFFAGYLDDSGRARNLSSSRHGYCREHEPNGQAERVEGGYRVTGQWSFGSGVSHADVVGL